MTVAMLSWGAFLPYLLHKGCLLQLTILPYYILAVGRKPSCLSAFNSVTFTSPKLAPRKGNPNFVAIYPWISHLKPFICYLILNCNQGKAGCMPCIAVTWEVCRKPKQHRYFKLSFVEYVEVYHRFQEAK